MRIVKSRQRFLYCEPLEDRRLLAITVDTLVDEADGSIVDGDVSLRDALAAARSRETIDFDASLDGGTILLTLGELAVTDALTIDATALAGGLTIDASGNDPTPDEDNGDGSRIFNIDDGRAAFILDVTIRGLTLTGGDVDRGAGAIRSREMLSVTSSTILGNSALMGGGAIRAFSALTVTSSTILGNSATRSGGGVRASGALTIVSSTISGNNSSDDGGGIHASGNVTVTDSTISENSSDGHGGGIYANGSVTVTDSTISENSSNGHGGGVASGDVTVANSTISGNSAISGGGIHAVDDVTVISSTISGNSATTTGGAIAEGTDSSRGDVTVINSTISGNTATQAGGISGWYVTVAGSTVSGNIASGNGGGIAVLSSLTLRSSTVSGNAANESGGGVFGGDLAGAEVIASTISGNTAGSSGGGIYSEQGDQTIENSIVAGNTDNGTAPDLLPGTGTLTARYSLIGDNTGTGLAEALVGMPDADGNLVGDPDGMGVIDPLLGPLADNDGPTKTHALLLGSPAIDAGDPDFAPPPDFDQRGGPFVRVFGLRVDMGAFERQAVTLPPVELVVDTLVDEKDVHFGAGDLSLREAVWIANYRAEADTITFDASLDGGTILLTLGELVITDSLTIDATALAGGLTIDASGNDPTPDEDNGDGSRIFKIDDEDFSIDILVTIKGLTLTGGDVDQSGGAIRAYEHLTVTSSTIYGNSARHSGGGIAGDNGSVTVTDSTVSWNSTGSRGGGGGVYASHGASATVTNSTISGNSAGSRGGGVYVSHGRSVTVTGSTISGNSAGSRGAGIWAWGDVTVTNSTISGNSAGEKGGGIGADGNVTVTYSTISDNSTLIGGGIYAPDGDVTIENSIVAGNTDDGTAPDIRRATGTLTVRYSLIGDNTGTALLEAPVGTPDADGNLIGGPRNGVIDPRLGPLADNGGPTQTHALLFGSPAIDMGPPSFTPPPYFDQRGAPFSRVFGGRIGRIDMGAFERHPVAPVNLVVDTLVDEMDTDFSAGDLSLREAVFIANLRSGADTITFETSLSNGTILLTQGELVVFDVLTINATALADGLTIDASGNDPTPNRDNGDGSRIFDIDDEDNGTDSPVAISGLTLTGGDADDNGGAIRTQEELTVTDSTISGNSSQWGGGGIYAEGDVTVTSSTISGNSARSDRGGGILASGDLTVIFSTISGNSAGGVSDGDGDGGGGGIYARGKLTVTSSTISGNSARSDRGGGILASGDLTVIFSTISGNSARHHGGGIDASGNVTLTSSTISRNSAEWSGGGISGGNVTVTSSTILGNSAVTVGGGIRASGSVTVTSSTISGNSTGLSGGGIRALGDVTVTSSTISGNSAFDGGGISVWGNVTVTIEHSIMAGNTDSGTAPDVRPGTGPLAVRYSLIGDNTSTGLTEAPVGTPDADGNLVGDPDGMGVIDPLLAPLADNGGPTLTHALLPGSPAVDMGEPGFTPPSDFDQRGSPFSRVFNHRIDIGAYERHTGDMDFDGDVDMDDVDTLVVALRDRGTYEDLYGAPPNSNGDTDGDGDLDFDDIPGFVNLLRSGARALWTASASFDVTDMEDDPADAKLSTETRQETSDASNAPRPKLLPILKKSVNSSRLQSASATVSRDLSDTELATIWSGDFDWRNGETTSAFLEE